MEKTAIMAKLTDVFKDVFDLDDVVLTYDTTADDIEDWDSLEHINLISAVESTFMMKLGEMVSIIEERTKL